MASERQKCLDTLGLSPTADEEEIKRAYRRLALQYHPDKNNNADAKSKFQQISYAYKYLTEGPDNNDDINGHDTGQFFEQMFRDMFFQQYMYHTHGRFGSPFCFSFDSDDDNDDFFIYYSDSDEEPFYYNRQSNGWFDNSHKTYRNPAKDVPSDPKVNKKKLRRQMKNKRQRERQKEKKKEKACDAKTDSCQSSKEEQKDNQSKQPKESINSTTESSTKSSSINKENAPNQNEERMKQKEKKKQEEKEKRKIEKEARETVANMLKKQKEKEKREKEKQRIKKEKEEEKDDISDWFFDDVHKSKKSKQKGKNLGNKANQEYRHIATSESKLPKGSKRQDFPFADSNTNRNNSSKPENTSSSSVDLNSNSSKNHIKLNSDQQDNLYKNRFDIMADEEKFDNIINGLVIGDSNDDCENSDDGQSDNDDEVSPPNEHVLQNGNYSTQQSENYHSKNCDKGGLHIPGKGDLHVPGKGDLHVPGKDYQPYSSSQNYRDFGGKKGTMTSQQYDYQRKPRVFTNTRFKQDDWGVEINDNIPNNQQGSAGDRSSTDGPCAYQEHVKSRDTTDVNGHNQSTDLKFAQKDKYSRSQNVNKNGVYTKQKIPKNGQYNGKKSNFHQTNGDTGYTHSHFGPNFHDPRYRHSRLNHPQPQGGPYPNAWDAGLSYPYYWEDYIDYGYRGQYEAYRGHQELRGHGAYRGHGEFRGQHGNNRDFRYQYDRYRGHGGEFSGSNRGNRDQHYGLRGDGIRGHNDGFRSQNDSIRGHHGFRENKNRGHRGFKGQGKKDQQKWYRDQHPVSAETAQNNSHQLGQEFDDDYNLYPHIGDDLSDSSSSLESLDEDQPSSSRKDSIDSISDSINKCSNHNPSDTCSSRNISERPTNDNLGIPQGMLHGDRMRNYYK